LDTRYAYPWYDYDGARGNDWIMAANPHPYAITATVTLGAAAVTTTVPAGGVAYVQRQLAHRRGGPLVIAATDAAGAPATFVSSQRSLWAGRSFEEAPGQG